AHHAGHAEQGDWWHHLSPQAAIPPRNHYRTRGPHAAPALAAGGAAHPAGHAAGRGGPAGPAPEAQASDGWLRVSARVDRSARRHLYLARRDRLGPAVGAGPDQGKIRHLAILLAWRPARTR